VLASKQRHRKKRRNRHRSRRGEVGVLYNPKTASFHSFQRPDGTWVKADGKENNIVTLINPEYYIAEAKDDGNPRNTLAYRQLHMMISATKLYGERDYSYAFAGIEFTPDDPHLRFYEGNHVIIQLHSIAMLDRNQAFGQLAHECVHLLSPTPGRPVKILEEGMAVAFSYVYMRDTMRVILPPLGKESYQEALDLVTLLLNIDQDGIKKMRKEEPTISNITKSLVLKYYPTLPEEVAARLTRTFVRDEHVHPDIIEIYNREE